MSKGNDWNAYILGLRTRRLMNIDVLRMYSWTKLLQSSYVVAIPDGDYLALDEGRVEPEVGLCLPEQLFFYSHTRIPRL